MLNNRISSQLYYIQNGIVQPKDLKIKINNVKICLVVFNNFLIYIIYKRPIKGIKLWVILNALIQNQIKYKLIYVSQLASVAIQIQ